MIELELRLPIPDQSDPVEAAIKKYKLNPSMIHTARITHRSLDARAGREAMYLYQIRFETDQEADLLHRLKQKARLVQPFHYTLPAKGSAVLSARPIVVGFGPCGMAAGLLLARAGYRPLILEQGPSIEERKEAVQDYWKTGVLDKRKNVQFGEGGAGAFSDGKLTTRIKDPRVALVLEELIKAGAAPSIAWLNHPHIGTDAFCEINIRIRKEIESLGGEIRFLTKLTDLVIQNGKVVAVKTEPGEEIPCEAVLLGLGNSARDTFVMLNEKQVELMSKPFAVGLRCEHLQSFIDARQYRNIRDYSSLPPAEYHLSHTSSLKKGVYSFCMCPGGYVIAAASSPDTVVTNGMSYSRRDGMNANSALVVQVDSSDFGSDLFDGMHYQEQLEHHAYRIGQGKAPAETIAHYLDPTALNEPTAVLPTYPLGVTMTDLHSLFHEPLNHSLEEMLKHTETIFPGFTKNGALFTGVETRTSSPIRIVRDIHTFESNIQGIFPSGEGAGYAGGIVSSAIDGIRCAEQIVSRYKPFIG